MATTQEVRSVLEKIKPRALKLLKAHKKETDELRSNIDKLERAMNAKQERNVRLQTKVLKDEIKQLSVRLNMTASLLQELQGLPAESLGSSLSLVEKMTNDLGELERKLNKNFGIANNALDVAHDYLAADDAEIDESEVRQAWANAKVEIELVKKDFAKRVDRVQKQHDKAKKAVAARDAAGLRMALDGARSVCGQMPTVKQTATEYARLFKRYDPGKLTKNVADQMKRDIKEFKDVFEDLKGEQKYMRELTDEIESMQVAGTDVKKAAKVLGVPKSHLGHLGKAFEQDDAKRNRMLEKLIEELGLDQDIKAVLNMLRKAKVIPG